MAGTSTRLLLRWSWRDLRRRWGLVLLTAVIISIGTGTWAGLGGSTPWRLDSFDASYDALAYRDLRVRLPTSTFAPEGSLAEGVATIDDADALAAVEERLIVPTQVDASTDGQTVLVPGELVGIPDASQVDLLHVASGRAARPGQSEAVLEAKFADARSLPSTGTVRVSGGTELTYTGTGFTPEYFQVLGSGFQITGAYGWAVLFAPLSTVQEVSGQTGSVNEVRIRLEPGADVDAVAAQVRAALADVGATVETAEDDTVRRSIYADANNDGKVWSAMSVLILLGASFAAFNLITRMVDAERHEIGVAMAIGTPVGRLALRPLLVGLQIALLGVLLGVAVGLWSGSLIADLMKDFLPLPVWITDLPVERYLTAMALGLVLPMAATAIPVRRALRVEPVEALHQRAGSSTRVRGVGFAPLLGRFGRRGSVVGTLPLRNLVRSPRRTVLTSLGIAASITTLVAVLGLLDSMGDTFGRSDGEIGRTAPDRLEVALTDFQPASSPVIASVGDAEGVSTAQASLRLGGTLRSEEGEVDTLIDVLDMDTAMWTPSVIDGDLPVGSDGLVIAEKAAADLGVGPGDTVELEHPRREGASYRMVTSTVEVAAVHPNPLRFLTYVDTAGADRFELQGIVNLVLVRPDAGVSADELKRTLFAEPGVSSVQEVAVFGQLLSQSLDQVTGVLRVLEGFGLVLALLIALNSATLAMEERRREQATMFAFGLPVRTVLRTMVVETFATAVLGTLVGLGLGYAAMHWLLHMVTTETFPEIGIPVLIHGTSVAAVLVLGVGVATAAPLFALRRLRRTDIPSTLRVLE